MSVLKNFIRSVLAMSLLLSVLGFSVQPAFAASPGAGHQAVSAAATCTLFHTVLRGENLSRIGLRFGVSWRTLARINNLSNPRLIFPGQKLCISTSQTPVTIPTFQIVSVVRNKTVTIRTNNFPASDTFRVLMGPFGTAGIRGIQVATFNSGSGGSKTATFNIPASLQGSRRIAIRLQSPTSGFFAFNWFFNNSTGTGTGGNPSTPSGYTGFPYFFISSVVRNQSVTIAGYNLPPNDTFKVLMGPFGTAGIGGIQVDTFNSGNGGTISATFNIPASLQGSRRIAIRLQSPTSGFFAFNWFFNTTASAP